MIDSKPARLRLSVAGAETSVFVIAPDDLPPATSRPGRQPDVRPLPLSETDRAAGVRRYEVTVEGWLFTVTSEDEARAILRERAGQGSAAARHHGPTVVTAPMPGRVVRIWVAQGDTVEAGQRLLAIEAMKMENEVRAPRGGTITLMAVSAESSVELGDELLTVR